MLVNQIVNKAELEQDEISFPGKIGNEIDYQGVRQPMRVRYNRGKSPMMEWYSDLGHGRWELGSAINSYIAKRVGKPFAQVFKEFKADPRFKDSNTIWDESPAHYFLSLFDNPKLRNRETPKGIKLNWRARAKEYIIDEDGNIQFNPILTNTPTTNTVKIYNPVPEWKYSANKTWLKCFQNAVVAMLGNQVYQYLMEYSGNLPDNFVEDVYRHLRLEGNKWKEAYPELFERSYHSSSPYYFGGDPGEHIFKCIFRPTQIHSSYEVEIGSKEEKDVRAKIKRDRRIARNKKKQSDKEYYDYILFVEKRRAKGENIPPLYLCVKCGSIEEAQKVLDKQNSNKED